MSDFDTTDELLGVMGFTAKPYQENKRELFLPEGAEVSIDTWPLASCRTWRSRPSRRPK
jgi:adenylate cyclase class 2